MVLAGTVQWVTPDTPWAAPLKGAGQWGRGSCGPQTSRADETSPWRADLRETDRGGQASRPGPATLAKPGLIL